MLREQLYGSEAVLTGRDVVNIDDPINDVEDAHRLFAVTPPDSNVLADIDASAVSRANRLDAMLDAILTRLSQSGDTAAGSIVAPTLLRVRLLGLQSTDYVKIPRDSADWKRAARARGTQGEEGNRAATEVTTDIPEHSDLHDAPRTAVAASSATDARCTRGSCHAAGRDMSRCRP
ncbi:hypothetical protein WMF28_20640 [Sorangium sp. So ce590]|uniref:hypothetical protein n=1 Tax=Sorangium sp. So ce590 TaxID=3133317 RepID=UPI003F63449C